MEKKRRIRIAIDGPGGAGKSSVAREVAKRRGFIYVDTGALYRAVGLFVARRGIASDDKEAIVACLPEIDIAFIPDGDRGIMTLGGEDVGGLIRTPEVSLYASAVSAIPEVREALLDLQKKFAGDGGVVMDGRDIGTVIIPDAELKLFLTASPEVRAKRRFLELEEKGTPQHLEEVLADIVKRDKADSEREIAPLKPAEGCVMVDTTELDFEQSVQTIISVIKENSHGTE